MSNKMLIDASHPEETRVAVVRGNRVEEFDFESQEKRQLRGNIYLAKVARVEPSLQAAFVDYGGNRHGFLAFSEIHPDYYQIPVADRQALLEAEAEEARAFREAEEREDGDDDAVEEEPKKKSRRRRSRKSKAATTDETSEEENTVDEAGESAEESTEAEAASDEASSEEPVAEEEPKSRSTRRRKAPVKKTDTEEPETAGETAETNTDSEEPAVEEEKPKRRSTRRKKAPVKKADDSSEDDGDDKPETMAAMVEMDEISEDLPESSSDEETPDAEPEEPVAEEKPKRKYTRRKKAPAKKAETDTTEETEAKADENTEETTSEEEKPKRKSTRRKPASRKKKADKAEEEPAKTEDDTSDENADTDNNQEEDTVESVGQEDALEEVPQPRRLRRHYKIQEVIKRRQVLLVQVVKEERGNKGAALTTYLSLAGRYSVLMPNTARGGGISRKITNAADRKRLKAIASDLDVPQGMGVILRTAGASRTNAEINRDFDYLMRLWEQVRNLTLSSSAPCLVYEEGSLIKRSIRDLYDKDTGEVIVAGDEGFKEAKDFMTMLMPTAAKKVKQHRDKQTIFAKFGVETQLDRMVTPQVTLKSGGYLIIDQTEALVAVDVNSGRSTREHSVEDTALQTNLEAAEEVSRQLRLRDLAGLIVIDFIDMEEKRNNRAVEKRLKDSLKNDRARIQVGRISHFGLMEMSRQRMRASVLESTMDVCSVCGGTGHVRSDSAIALHVFRAIEEHVSRHNKYDAVIKTTSAIAMNLLNFKRASLLELEQRYGLQIIVEASAEIKGQDFDIEKGEIATGEAMPSAVGMQNGSSFEAVDSDEEQEEGKGRGRGRNRNRNRNRKTRDDDAEQVSEDEDQTAEASEDDDDKPRKKRRRGKRGGRNRKTDDEANAETAEADSVESDTEASQAEAPQEGEAPQETSSEDEKPKSRSTRRKKAPIAKKVEEPAETEALVSEETAEPGEATTEAEEKPKRRTTRRKTAPVAEETGTPEEATISEEPATSDSEAETLEDKPKKKTSWWNRGGGFF